MAKLRSYFASNLDYLKSSITYVLSLSAVSSLDEADFNRFLSRFQEVSTFLSNHNYFDLIRKSKK